MNTMNQRERDALDHHITREPYHYLYSDEQEDEMIQPWHLDNEPLYDNSSAPKPELMAAEFTDNLQGLLAGDFAAEDVMPGLQTSTFRDSGVLTTNDGLVVRLADGSEYQLTVVRSR